MARADGTARRAGHARGRLSVVYVGRLAQSVRLARRGGVSDLGLPAALPPARARRSPPRCLAVHPRARRRWNRGRQQEPLLEPLSRAARRTGARGFRGLYARRRAFGALPVAGTTTEATRELDPSRARTRALAAGRGGGANDCL